MLKVILYGFQGHARLAKGSPPLIAKGHIGLSADNGKTIYGFAPIKPHELNDKEFLFLLKRKRQIFDGQLIDDTVLFNQIAAGKFNKGIRELELYRLKQTVDEITFTKVLQQIEKRGKGSKYMLPHENIPFLPNTYNCATFWEQTGVILPEKSGILRDYIPAMINQGAERVELAIVPIT
ncbi:hypothetical protein [Candidatus Parabeggiatoa sp. HSG14]|uniref:hypothetical protein n=1 Tax=Candidatus Parabeggiatoa sp. HSG14 TaxID=3055593 RepID=UPI0025A8A500|nr:hypothetical protein [Thiotrichales bacterium HSG14]